jgi:hypothetical protein
VHAAVLFVLHHMEAAISFESFAILIQDVADLETNPPS